MRLTKDGGLIMSDDQFKVPEAVLEAAQVKLREWGGGWDDDNSRKAAEEIAGAALAQHHKELLGDEAADSALGELLFDEVPARHEIRDALQAAIDSVMKGGDDD